jgi:hypothetical protein
VAEGGEMKVDRAGLCRPPVDPLGPIPNSRGPER